MADYDPRLVEYALGVLAPEERAELERELETSARLRTALADIQDTFDELDDAETVVTPRPALTNRLMASVGGGAPDGFVDRMADLFDLAIHRARSVLGELAAPEQGGWIDHALPGVRLLHFDGGARVAGQDCGLVRLDPGTGFPRHRHTSDEWALMLEGEIVEDSGARFLPGDLVFKASGTVHSFVATPDAPAAFAVLTRIDGLEFF